MEVVTKLKIGIYGGTFDPVHNGHLRVAEHATKVLGLEKIVFIPAGNPYLKPGRPVASASDRLAMLKLSIAGQDRMEVSRLEMDRAGVTYTVDTMRQLKEAHPEVDLYFILGQDILPELPRWHQPAELLELCRIVAAPRPGANPPDLTALGKLLPGSEERIILLTGPEIDLSASGIRHTAARGDDISGMVSAAVAGYIREQGLYKTI
ncbi:nicotinate-nucleotide adenylyltransferase [Chloroflexota bacterium]